MTQLTHETLLSLVECLPVIGPYESEEAAFRAASMHVLVTVGYDD